MDFREGSTQARRRAEDIFCRLRSREDQRKAGRDQSRREAEISLAPEESAEEVYQNWKLKEQSLLTRLDTLPDTVSTSTRPSDELALAIADLEKEAAAASHFLTDYHAEQIRACCQSLKDRLKASKEATKPRKKFAFTGRAHLKPTSSEAAENKQDSAVHTALPAAKSDDRNSEELIHETNRSLRSLSEQIIVKSAHELSGGDFLLEDLSDCKIFLLGALSALRAHNLTNCKVVAGPISGAALLYAGQVRLHDSHRMELYMRVRSQPVIERCEQIRVGACDTAAFQKDALCSASLDDDNAKWAQVQDFGWIRSNSSPNWSVLAARDGSGDSLVEEARQLRKQS